MTLLGRLTVRVAVGAATLIVLSVLVFWATEVLPGDASGALAGPDATDAERVVVRAALGLDRPPVERYLDWAGGLLRGDLGTSMVSGRDVAEVVLASAEASAAVLLPATVLILVLAGGLGAWAGLRAGSHLDRALSGATLALIAIPDFLVATALLLVFTLWWPVLPAVAIIPAGQSLWARPELLVLPVAALTLGAFGATMRLLRACVARAAALPYAEFARLNGVRGPCYVRVVAVNAAGPAVHAFTLVAGGLLGGGVVVETLFNVPGVGYELSRAVATRDVPLVQGISLLLAAVTLLVLLVGDVIARLLDAPGTAAVRSR